MSDAAEFCHLVFTDLDGSLLDHHNYSYQSALPLLRRLEWLAIPVIPASSKTRTEIAHLRDELDNRHPFIVENGAAVFIPEGYFDQQPAGTVEREGFWIREMSPPRRNWLNLLEHLDADYPDCFDYFHRAGVEGIMRMTNLPRERAREANEREYSEPVKWFGKETDKREFLARLADAGAVVLQGGRFMSVAGDCDKGRALIWLREAYETAHGKLYRDIAIGDSGNDCAMLEAAHSALVIRSTVHDFPSVQRSQRVYFSEGYGPDGWSEGVARWLELQGLNNRKN